MMKIVSIVVRDDRGREHRYDGEGEARVVDTRTEVEGLPPAKWPQLKFLSAHLVVKP
jgi:hypothetical protein